MIMSGGKKWHQTQKLIAYLVQFADEVSHQIRNHMDCSTLYLYQEHHGNQLVLISWDHCLSLKIEMELSTLSLS